MINSKDISDGTPDYYPSDEDEKVPQRTVALCLPDYILSEIDSLRGDVPRPTFLRMAVTAYLGLDNVYGAKQAWRLLPREEIIQRQKKVIDLHLQGSLTQKEIAKLTGLSQGRVCRLIHLYYKNL